MPRASTASRSPRRTKAFNLAGLKSALIVTASERGDQVRAAMPYEVEWRMSQFGAIAPIAAFREGGPWLDGVLGSLDDNRRLLADLLADELPGVRLPPSRRDLPRLARPQGPGLGRRPRRVRARAREGRARRAARVRRDRRPGHARLEFACTPEVLAEAVAPRRSARLVGRVAHRNQIRMEAAASASSFERG